MGLFQRLAGTMSSFFQLGGPRGAGVRNNGGVVEARDSTNATFAIVRAADPVASNDLVTLESLSSGGTGIPFPNLQDHHTVYWMGMNTSSNTAFAWGFKQLQQAGTQTEGTPTAGSTLLASLRRCKYSVTSALNQLGLFESFNGAGSRYFWKGDAAGRGGFKICVRWAVVSSGNNSAWVHHYGIDDSNVPAAQNWLTNTTTQRVAITQTYTATAGGAIPASTNWQITECNGTTNTLTDTGLPVVHGDVMELLLYCPPNGTIQWTLNDLTASTTASGTCTTSPPTDFMAPCLHANITTAGTGTCEMDGILFFGEMFN